MSKATDGELTPSAMKSELLQSRAQRKMLIKELKFVREQLTYHRKQLARAEADKTEIAQQLGKLKSRVIEAEADKTKVLTRSVAEKHMLANEIAALEDTFMANSSKKENALDAAHTQIMMLRKEVRLERTKMAAARQKLSQDYNRICDELATRNAEIASLREEIENLKAVPTGDSATQPASPHQQTEGQGIIRASSSSVDLDEGGDDDDGDGPRIKKQRDMLERENIALTRRITHLQAQLEAAEKRREPAPVDEAQLTPEELKEQLLSSNQKLTELQEASESDSRMLRTELQRMESEWLREKEQREALADELQQQHLRLRNLQEELSETKHELLQLREETSVGSSITKALSKFKAQT